MATKQNFMKSEERKMPKKAPRPAGNYHRVREARQILISSIIPDRKQPRRDMDLGPILSSIREFGLRDPITLKPKENKFIIIDGERRYRVAKKMGLKSILAVIDESDVDPALTRLVLSEHFKSYNPIEEAELYRQVQKAHNFSNRQLATWARKTEGHISGMLKVAALPEDEKEKLQRAKVPQRVATVFARKSPEERAEAIAELEVEPQRKIDHPKIGEKYGGPMESLETDAIKKLQRRLLLIPVPNTFKGQQAVAFQFKQTIREIHSMERNLIQTFNALLTEVHSKRKSPKGKAQIDWIKLLPSRLEFPGPMEE